MPPLPSSSSDASLVTHEIQDRLLTKFRYLTDSLDLGLQCAACRWLFVEKDNVIRMLGEFWPDIFVILLVCSLVSLDRKSTRLKSSHSCAYRMPSSASKKKNI